MVKKTIAILLPIAGNAVDIATALIPKNKKIDVLNGVLRIQHEIEAGDDKTMDDAEKYVVEAAITFGQKLSEAVIAVNKIKVKLEKEAKL